MATNHKPLVWLPACHRHLDLSDPGGYTVLADRYAAAVCRLGLQAVLFPMADAADVPDLLPLVDGVLLTGSPSNVEATHFGESALAHRRARSAPRPADDGAGASRHRRRHAPVRRLPRPAGDERRARRQPLPAGPRRVRAHGPPRAGPTSTSRPSSPSATTSPWRRAALSPTGRAGRRRGSTRCTARASSGSARASSPRRMRPTAWSRACAWPRPRPSPTACSGTRSGTTTGSRSTSARWRRSRRPAASTARDGWVPAHDRELQRRRRRVPGGRARAVRLGGVQPSRARQRAGARAAVHRDGRRRHASARQPGPAARRLPARAGGAAAAARAVVGRRRADGRLAHQRASAPLRRGAAARGDGLRRSARGGVAAARPRLHRARHPADGPVPRLPRVQRRHGRQPAPEPAHARRPGRALGGPRRTRSSSSTPSGTR
jgi:hypothetical protein